VTFGQNRKFTELSRLCLRVLYERLMTTGMLSTVGGLLGSAWMITRSMRGRKTSRI
jgi:hypothetical protein